MKNIILGFIVFLFLALTTYADDRPKFLILCQANGDTAIKYADAFETVMASYLKDEFSCAQITKRSTIVTSLERERLNQLLGDGNDGTISNLGKDMNYDYLVRLILKTFEGQKIFVRAVCLERKNAKCVADANYILVSMDYAGVKEGINSISKTLVALLLKKEICPFRGDINIKIVTTHKDKQVDNHPVYCNGMDGYYKKSVTIDKYSENDWKITKTGKNSATGFVKFNLSEEFLTEEEDPCHECSPTKIGPRTYKEKRKTYADIQGLSNESESYGIPVDDARVEIVFSETGTYIIKVSAASKRGKKKSIEEITAQGICDNENSPPDKWENNIDEGLEEVFGPITGTPQYKTLFYKITIPRKNEFSGEDETITYEFNLTRE